MASTNLFTRRTDLATLNGSIFSLLALTCCMLILLTVACRRNDPPAQEKTMSSSDASAIDNLPAPSLRGDRSLEQTLASRRSTREFTDDHLTDEQISQLLWAAQGINNESAGLRTAPSAGALYPLELYLATSSGFYHFVPGQHRLVKRSDQDLRKVIHGAALSQDAVLDAPVVFVIAGVYARTRTKYGARAERYVHMEAGHAAQNLLLQAVALDLGGVPIGAFEDGRLRRVLGLPKNESPLYLIPIGHPR